MRLQRTESVPPQEMDVERFLRRRLLTYICPQKGFVLSVQEVRIPHTYVSPSGNYICTIDADVECFLPEVGMVLEATVQIHRGTAHIALARDRFQLLFHTEPPIQEGSVVQVRVTHVQYQCGTYRGLGVLETSSS